MPVGVEDLYLAADYLVNSYIKDPKNCSKELEFFHERLEDTTLQTQEQVFYRLCHPIKKSEKYQAKIKNIEAVKMRLAVEIILKKIVSKLFKDDGDLKSNDTWKRLPHLKQDGDFSKGGGDIFSIFFAFSNNNEYGESVIKEGFFNLFFKENSSAYNQKILRSILLGTKTSPLSCACGSNNTKLVVATFQAIKEKIPQEDQVKFLMELLTAANKEGYTPLINACANSATEIVKAIFAAVKEMIPEEERAELLMRLLTATNNEGYMPLISACANNSHDIVKAIFAAVRKMIPEEKRA